MLSGESVELNVFVELALMSAAAGYKQRARNMTALGRDSIEQNCLYWRRPLGNTMGGASF